MLSIAVTPCAGAENALRGRRACRSFFINRVTSARSARIPGSCGARPDVRVAQREKVSLFVGCVKRTVSWSDPGSVRFTHPTRYARDRLRTNRATRQHRVSTTHDSNEEETVGRGAESFGTAEGLGFVFSGGDQEAGARRVRRCSVRNRPLCAREGTKPFPNPMDHQNLRHSCFRVPRARRDRGVPRLEDRPGRPPHGDASFAVVHSARQRERTHRRNTELMEGYGKRPRQIVQNTRGACLMRASTEPRAGRENDPRPPASGHEPRNEP
jgi:hypothetical protein